MYICTNCIIIILIFSIHLWKKLVVFFDVCHGSWFAYENFGPAIVRVICERLLCSMVVMVDMLCMSL